MLSYFNVSDSYPKQMNETKVSLISRFSRKEAAHSKQHPVSWVFLSHTNNWPSLFESMLYRYLTDAIDVWISHWSRSFPILVRFHRSRMSNVLSVQVRLMRRIISLSEGMTWGIDKIGSCVLTLKGKQDYDTLIRLKNALRVLT